jgi:hypothetical protein
MKFYFLQQAEGLLTINVRVFPAVYCQTKAGFKMGS